MATINTPSTAPASAVPGSADGRLRWGSGIMAAAGLGFIAYAVIFFVRNFTDSFLEVPRAKLQVRPVQWGAA